MTLLKLIATFRNRRNRKKERRRRSEIGPRNERKETRGRAASPAIPGYGGRSMVWELR